MSPLAEQQEREQRSLRRGIILGGIALLVLAVGLFSMYKVFGHGLTVYTAFDNADGLHPGAEIRFAGVRIGKVKAVRLTEIRKDADDNAPLVEVEMDLEQTVYGQDLRNVLFKDATAALRHEGSLADRVIDIQSGTPKSGPIQQGDHIRGVVEPSFFTIAQRGDTFNRNMSAAQEKFIRIGEDLKAGKGTLGSVLYKTELKDRFAELTREMAAFEADLGRGPGNISRLRGPAFKKRIDKLKNLLLTLRDDLQAGSGTLGKLYQSDELQQSVERLADRFARLGERIENVRKQYDAGDGALGKFAKDDRFKENVRQLRARMKKISEGLDRGEGTAGKLLHDPRLSNTLGELSSEFLKTAYDMRQSPFRYIRVRFSLF